MGEDRTRMHVAGASPYDVVVGHHILDELPALVGPEAERVAVLYDGDLTGLSALVRMPLLNAGYEVEGVPLNPPGEASKSYCDGRELLGAAGTRPASRARTWW